ncbi:putative hypothetical protein [Streptomyces sp. NBRC 110611]|uniref:DUF7848 domain-containing protein n=1 Tax=Streptomyces sp. NBRC 110611 TaxID=1621259 RepID=UPI00082BF7F8|nr:hypothetical protein [Streptomyces sp. NBRC 110611]GAU67453.1 putative hypothetical protein [Streptomyces sp. NBRC 110611]
MRARYRFLEWTLSAVPGMVVRHLGKCLICAEHSVDTADASDAQTWCLQHAGATRHNVYELSAFQYFDATLTDPTADRTPPTA